LLEESLTVQSRGRLERLPLAQVLYLKAELKYLTVVTATAAHLLEGSLSELEQRHGNRFIRIHRNALVARSALCALDRHEAGPDGSGWVVRLHGLDEALPVSRRQLAAVREALGA
jgi:two-component system response regulator AlgR